MYSPDIIAEALTDDPNCDIYSISEEFDDAATDVTSYPWVWGPDDHGFAIIKVQGIYYLVELPDASDTVIDDYPILQRGWPSAWGLDDALAKSEEPLDLVAFVRDQIVDLDEPHKVGPGPDSPTGLLRTPESWDDEEEIWPDELEYDDIEYKKLESLGQHEREFAEKFDVSPEEVGALRFYAIISREQIRDSIKSLNIRNLTGKIPQELNWRACKAIITDHAKFAYAVEVMLKKHRQFVSSYLKGQTTQNERSSMLIELVSRVLVRSRGFQAVQEVAKSRSRFLVDLCKVAGYIPDNPGTAAEDEAMVRKLGHKTVIKQLAMDGDRFLRIIAQVAKTNGLGKTLTSLSANDEMQNFRYSMISNYLDENWTSYVGDD